MTKDEIKKSIETMICIKAEGARGVWCSESDNAYDSSTYLATEEIEVILQALQHLLEELNGTCKTAYDENHVPYLVKATGSEAKHIIELLTLEAQDKLVKLPCKVGDKIYYLRSYTVGHFDTGYVVQDTEFSINCLNRDFGLKSCFYLTKAEAEAKLKEIRGE